jgi:hypothetical protein
MAETVAYARDTNLRVSALYLNGIFDAGDRGHA